MSALMTFGQGQTSDLPAAAIVATCALVFTVASFWWLNARRGRLKAYEPHSFAACVTMKSLLVRLPLVVHNTGAAPIVAQDLRLRFSNEPADRPSLAWRTSRSQLMPRTEDGHALPAVFAVTGREAKQLFLEFGVSLPGFVPEPRGYVALVEAKLGHREGWQSLLSFTLHFDHVAHPGNYITYHNSPDAVTEQDRKQAETAFEALAAKIAAADGADT